MPEALPLWLVAASLALNAIFLRRLLSRLDDLYACVVGSPERPGLADRVRRIEELTGLAESALWPEVDRRHGERRGRLRKHE